MMIQRSLVTVIDDDESVRESLPDLLRELGYAAEAFSSAEEFLVSGSIDQTGCLLLDIGMPGMSGPDLQKELTIQGRGVPIIFITGNREGPAHRGMLRRNAIDCLYKPFSDRTLVEALNTAFDVSRTMTW